MNQLAESLKAKTAGLPNWVWATGAGILLALLLFRSKGNASADTTTDAVSSPSIVGGIPVTSGGGGGSSSGGGGSEPSHPEPCPGYPNCGPAPSAGPGGATPPQSGPPGSIPPYVPPPPPVNLSFPHASFSVAPLMVAAGFDINVDVYTLEDADTVQVWASGSNDGDFPSAGFTSIVERPRNAVPFHVQIPSSPYQGKHAVFVHLDLKRQGTVVATGNKNMGGFDATLVQKVLLV